MATEEKIKKTANIKVVIDYADGEKPQLIKIPFAKGSIVYLKHDIERTPYVFIGFSVIGDNVLYNLDCAGEEVDVYDFEVECG